MCAATVEEYAKSDPHLAGALRAVGEFAIMLFLGGAAEDGLPSHVSGQMLSLHVVWSPNRFLIIIVIINIKKQAVKAKLQTLAQEFEHLQSSASHIKW